MLDVFVWGIATVLVILTVLIHYETILIISDKIIPRLRHFLNGRPVIAVVMGALTLGHIAEIWLFAFAMMFLTQTGWCGSIKGDFDGSFSDFLYFSAVNYTSLGYGDILPEGRLRAITSSEVLIGLLMIAWSASFTYLKMEQIWKNRSNG